MKLDFVDEVTSTTATGGPVQVVEEVGGRAAVATRGTPKPDGRVTPIAESSDEPERVLPESVRAKLAAIRAANEPEPTKTEPDGEPDAAEPAPEPADDADPDAPIEGTPAPAAKPADPPAEHPELAELRATVERQRAMLEAGERQPPPERVDARAKLLTEAADLYLSDPAAAVRRLVAASLYAADPEDKDVGEEVEALLTDLTALRMGVEPDPAYKAQRMAARTRFEWAREKRMAEAAKTAATGQTDASERDRQVTTATEWIGNRLKSEEREYPNLTQLALHLDGKPASRVIFEVLENGVRTGLLDPKDDDEKLFKSAAKLAETYYQKRGEALRKHFQPSAPAPDAAAPSKGSAGTDAAASKDARKGHGARTVTNDTASAAPATTPSARTPTDRKPVFKTNEERRRYAMRHLARS